MELSIFVTENDTERTCTLKFEDGTINIFKTTEIVNDSDSESDSTKNEYTVTNEKDEEIDMEEFLETMRKINFRWEIDDAEEFDFIVDGFEIEKETKIKQCLACEEYKQEEYLTKCYGCDTFYCKEIEFLQDGCFYESNYCRSCFNKWEY